MSLRWSHLPVPDLYRQAPNRRPPLHHFVWMSVPLSLLAGPLRKREGRKKPKQKYTVFFSFSALPWKAIHPCKILTFSSAVLVSQRFALISRIFKHPAAYHYDSVIKGINSCEHVPELQVNFNVGWRSIQNKMMMQLDVAIISWCRTSAGLRKPIKRQVINARKAI